MNGDRRGPDRGTSQQTFVKQTLQGKFEAWAAANPHIYAKAVQIARAYNSRGVRVGMKHIWEVMRWLEFTRTKADTFKLNNNWTSRYVRMIEAREPDLRGYFAKRRLTARDVEIEEER